MVFPTSNVAALVLGRGSAEGGAHGGGGGVYVDPCVPGRLAWGHSYLVVYLISVLSPSHFPGLSQDIVILCNKDSFNFQV